MNDELLEEEASEKLSSESILIKAGLGIQGQGFDGLESGNGSNWFVMTRLMVSFKLGSGLLVGVKTGLGGFELDIFFFLKILNRVFFFWLMTIESLVRDLLTVGST